MAKESCREMLEEQREAIGGLDIGGAHLKAYRPGVGAISVSFEVWRAPDRLEAALVSLIEGIAPLRALAVTMTAELCDSYVTRRQGVLEIIAAVERATSHSSHSRAPEVLYWTTASTFVGAEAASRAPLLCAASNWLALATLAARSLPNGARTALLVDVGSTTTDIIPLRDGEPDPLGRDDVSRLAAQELVYTGASRTPICAIVRTLPWRGAAIPVAAELFATARDAHLILGREPEAPADVRTADGRPATRQHALARMARMLCLDSDDFTPEDAAGAAKAIFDQQRRVIGAAAESVLARLGATRENPATLIVSGSGEHLARAATSGIEALGSPAVALSERLGPEVSACAPAYAVAALLAENAATEGTSPRSRRGADRFASRPTEDGPVS